MKFFQIGVCVIFFYLRVCAGEEVNNSSKVAFLLNITSNLPEGIRQQVLDAGENQSNENKKIIIRELKKRTYIGLSEVGNLTNKSERIDAKMKVGDLLIDGLNVMGKFSCAEPKLCDDFDLSSSSDGDTVFQLYSLMDYKVVAHKKIQDYRSQPLLFRLRLWPFGKSFEDSFADKYVHRLHDRLQDAIEFSDEIIYFD